MTPETLAPLKVQWRAEHRIRSRIVWENQRRLAELEEMLRGHFGESAAVFVGGPHG